MSAAAPTLHRRAGPRSNRTLCDTQPVHHQLPHVVVLRVDGLTRRGNAQDQNATVLADVGLEVHRGEILGIAGLVGAGRTEMARAVFGADRFDSGRVLATLTGLTGRASRFVTRTALSRTDHEQSECRLPGALDATRSDPGRRRADSADLQSLASVVAVQLRVEAAPTLGVRVDAFDGAALAISPEQQAGAA